MIDCGSSIDYAGESNICFDIDDGSRKDDSTGAYVRVFADNRCRMDNACQSEAGIPHNGSGVGANRVIADSNDDIAIGRRRF